MPNFLSGASSGSGPQFDDATGQLRATTSMILHSGTVWTILAIIFAAMIGIGIGMWAFIVWKDRNYTKGKTTSTFLEVIVGIVVTVALIILVVLAIITVWVYPGPALAQASARQRSSGQINSLIGDEIKIANARVRQNQTVVGQSPMRRNYSPPPDQNGVEMRPPITQL